MSSRKKVRRLFHLGAALLLASGTQLPAQQELPPELQRGASSDVPVALQIARWRMLDGDTNTIMFRNMDALFPARTVARAGPVWDLPRAHHPLGFTYEFEGTSYTPEQFLLRTYTNAMLVMKDGKIVSEIYLNNTNERTRFIGWSMTKSITAILIGNALQEGRIKSLDDPITAYLPELEGGGYDGTTIRQIMQMRSGVDYEERYDFANPGTAASNHINSLVKNVTRFADAARTVKRAHVPGEVFQYKTLDTAVLGWLLERVSGGSNVASYTAQRLWEPLGTESDGFYIMDGQPGTGREFSGAGFNATLRDFARIGQMMLDGGVANGNRIVPEAWVKEISASATEPRGPYAMQWWLMGDSRAYAAIGLQGQYIYVDPDTRTVVVKLSYFPPGNESASEETAAFLAAVSDWSPR